MALVGVDTGAMAAPIDFMQGEIETSASDDGYPGMGDAGIPAIGVSCNSRAALAVNQDRRIPYLVKVVALRWRPL